MQKNYNQPLFDFIKFDGTDATFFVASGAPVPGATGTFSVADQKYSKGSW